MTAPAASLPFEIEVPEGWTGILNPRDGVIFEVIVDEPVGFASRVSIELVEPLVPGPNGAGPMEALIGQRVSLLTETMTDGRFLDLALYGPRPADGEQPAFAATVAYRHGPHLVTALLWTIPLEDGALVITALTDADMMPVDLGAFSIIIDSLRTGDNIDPTHLSPIPDQVPVDAEPQPERASLAESPAGWLEGPLGDERQLRQMIADDPRAVPAVISVMLAPELPGDALDRHQAVLDDLGSTMTDAELQDIGADELAIGGAQRSLVVFRQGEGLRTADVWTGDDDPSLPIIWAICDFDDDEGRERAVAWIRQASREELGAG